MIKFYDKLRKLNQMTKKCHYNIIRYFPYYEVKLMMSYCLKSTNLLNSDHIFYE